MLDIPATVSAVPAIRGLCGSLLGLCTLSVVGRFWARSLQNNQFQADDWIMIPAWMTFVGLCACLLKSTYIHTLGYTPQQAAPYHPSALDGAKIQITIDILLALCLGFVKISALLFYKRVFCVPDLRSSLKTTINIGVIAISLWTITYIIFPLSMCGTHIDGFWNRPIWNKYCRLAHPYLLSGSVTDVFFELLVVILPLFKIWSLQTTTQRRLAVTLIFLTALLSLGASIARLAIVGYLAVQTVTDAAVAAFANSAIFFMWTLEAGSAIIAINMPSLWYFSSRKAPEKILRSLRSIMSLGSLKSRDSRGSGKAMSGDAEACVARPSEHRSGSVDRVEGKWPRNVVQVHIDGTSISTGEQTMSYNDEVLSTKDIKVTSQVSQHFDEL